MAAAIVDVWEGRRPPDAVLARRINELLPADRRGHARITDPMGNDVRVDLDWLLEHLGHHPEDRNRWQLIPAVPEAIRQARHLEWLLIVVAHLTKDLPTQMEWCDALFIKEPAGKEISADRDEAQRYWQATDKAYKDLRRSGLRGKPIEGWVYVDAEGLGYRGMMPYGLAGAEDPHQVDGVRTVDGPPYPDREVIDQ